MRDWKSELTGRMLVLVAHADDESVGYGALLQKMREAVVVIATDGTPRDPFFWGCFGSREAYREVRRGEARQAMRCVGVNELVLLADEDARLEDQRLFLNLEAAYVQLQKVVERIRPEAIATLAYEGGHPDHDSCSVLGMRLGQKYGVPVWEAPLYSRAQDRSAVRLHSHMERRDGVALSSFPHSPTAGGCGPSVPQPPAPVAEPPMRIQRFVCETDAEVLVEISAEELERKRGMCAQYRSQGDFLRTFDAQREVVRPQVKYDYGLVPHEGRTNYEVWQWWMSGPEVSAKFAEFLEKTR